MSFFHIFSGRKSSNLEKRGDANISKTVSDDFSGRKVPQHNTTSGFVSSKTQSRPINRSAMATSSMRLSLTDLLEQVEQQTEMSSKLFPLIDKERYWKKKSISSDSEPEMEFEQHKKDNSREKIVNDKYVKDKENSSLPKQDVMCSEKGAACSFVQTEGITSESESSLIVTNTLQPPGDASADFKSVFSTRETIPVWFGVHIEYMDNKLKIGVLRVGNEAKEKNRKRFAKLFLMPGNLQCQKVNVTNGTCISQIQKKAYAYFSDMNESDLVKMQVGVRIYTKKWLLKKDKLIIEWFIPMQGIDLMGPQTAWRSC